jgi:hypothetical protein
MGLSGYVLAMAKELARAAAENAQILNRFCK